MKHLSAPSVACLKHLQTHGSATSRELEALQRGLDRGWARSDIAIRNTPYNLRALGYVDSVDSVWRLTDRGLDALEANRSRASGCAGPHAVDASAELRYRRVPYGTGLVRVPIAPRWVFDVAGSGDPS